MDMVHFMCFICLNEQKLWATMNRIFRSEDFIIKMYPDFISKSLLIRFFDTAKRKRNK